MKLIDREPTQEMLKAIASSDCAPSNYKQMFQSAYDAAPEVNQEPVAIVGELYPQTKIELSRKGIPVGAFLYTLPPDAQAEIAKRDERIASLIAAGAEYQRQFFEQSDQIKKLESKNAGLSDLTGLMQSSLEGDTQRISELLDERDELAAQNRQLKDRIDKLTNLIENGD